MEELFGAVIQVVVYGILVNTGKALVFAGSLGRGRSERVLSNEHRRFPCAGSLWHRVEGQFVITETGLLFLGIAFYVLLVIGLLFLAAR